MKHVVNRIRTADKPKTKALAQVKAIAAAKPAAKKPTGKIALKSQQTKPIQKVKTVAKTASIDSPRAAKTADKQKTPKTSAKKPNAVKTVSAGKIKVVVEQPKQPKVNKAVPKNSAETVKIPSRKTQPILPNQKVAVAEKKTKIATAPQAAKPRTATPQPKISVKSAVKNSLVTAKFERSKVADRTIKPQPQSKTKIANPAAKHRSAKVETAANVDAKTNTVSRKAKLIVAPKNILNVGKSNPTVAAKTGAQKKPAPAVPAKTADLQSKKIQSIASTKKVVRAAKEIKSNVTAPKTVEKAIAVKPPVTTEMARGKKQKLPTIASAAPFKKRDAKIETTIPRKEAKAFENTIEAVPEARPPKPKNKKARPIGLAVFRGKKERYDFKVFALNEVFEPIPAVYIISKRITDKRKKGHHALICIGETASIADELKKHRKGKCVKKHQANVVSILPETDVKTRLRIETDLKAAHAVACVLD